MKQLERSRRFRRLHGEKKAVSPVVATLILILIAVAAAAALYLWLVVWQGNITSGIGQTHAQATVTVGGSTSVYPFSSLAASWFEQNNSDVVISDNQGGTGAGMDAVCAGNIDVGASSTPQTASTLETSYGCSNQPGLTVTTIAYDAVDVVIASSNTHGVYSMNWDTLNVIYEQASWVNGAKPSLFATTMDGASDSGLGLTASTALDWDMIPACVASNFNLNMCNGQVEYGEGTPLAAISTGATIAPSTGWALPAETSITTVTDTGTLSLPYSSFASLGGFAGISSLAADFTQTYNLPAGWTSGTVTLTNFTAGSGSVAFAFKVAFLSTAAGSAGPATVATYGVIPQEVDYTVGNPCGWSVCATGTAAIVPVERSDASGTTQTFEAKLLGAGVGASSSSSSWAGSFANLGYAGCGGNNVLTDCGINLPAAQQETGNPGVLSYVAGSPNAIGYASDGLARTTSGIGKGGIVPFAGIGQQYNISAASGDQIAGGVVPTTGAGGTISAGVKALTTAPNYVGTRPFQFVTLQPPTGEVQAFITFITDPATNTALASATAEVGLYQV